MTLNRRERILLYATISFLLVGGTYLLFGMLLGPYRTLRGQLANQRRELAGFRDRIQHRDEWQQEYDALRQRLGEQMTEFKQMSDVLKKIDEVAHASGVQIVRRTPGDATNRGSYHELPVAWQVEATTESLVKFLYALRTSSGFVSVEKLSIRRKPNSNVLACDITVHALAGQGEPPSS